MLNELTLVGSAESWKVEGGLIRKRMRLITRTFLNIVIDGKALRDSFAPAHSDRLIPPLSADTPRDAALAAAVADALLGNTRGMYQDGCVPVLICGVDNDAYCGVVGARVALRSDAVTWSLGWHLLDAATGSVQGHTEPAAGEYHELTFLRSSYARTINAARMEFLEHAKGKMPFEFVPSS